MVWYSGIGIGLGFIFLDDKGIGYYTVVFCYGIFKFLSWLFASRIVFLGF
jgi:hypothetical protein